MANTVIPLGRQLCGRLARPSWPRAHQWPARMARLAQRWYSGDVPPAYFRNEGVPPKTYDELQQPPVNDSNKPYNKYADIGRGLAYGSVAASVMYLLFEQREELEKAKKQSAVIRKSQKEMLVQMQNYKKKVAATAVKSTQKHTMLEGKMQMHIALLREQLIANGQEPVSIDKALEEFEDKVRMSTTSDRVMLWVPGEAPIKRLIPDPNEYDRKSQSHS